MSPQEARRLVGHPDIVVRLRLQHFVADQSEGADEIERLRERCEAYKGQVMAGSAEIDRLRTALRVVLNFIAHTDKDWALGCIQRAVKDALREGEAT